MRIFELNDVNIFKSLKVVQIAVPKSTGLPFAAVGWRNNGKMVAELLTEMGFQIQETDGRLRVRTRESREEEEASATSPVDNESLSR